MAYNQFPGMKERKKKLKIIISLMVSECLKRKYDVLLMYRAFVFPSSTYSPPWLAVGAMI